MYGKDESLGADEVGGQAKEKAPLAQRLEDQAEAALFEVPEAAVNQAAGAGAGAPAQVMGVDQGNGHSPEGGVAGDPCAGDPSADDQQVPLPLGQPGQGGTLGGRGNMAQEQPPDRSVADGGRPSDWFQWHRALIRPGSRVLDLACGSGRHSLAAAEAGATVLAVDRDAARLAEARRAAQRQGARITWLELDLEQPWPDFGVFDAVLLFHYLDRERMSLVRDCVAPGGVLLMETFLEAQQGLGWGPRSPQHLLRPMELASLLKPLDLVHAREVFQPVDASRWAWIGSALARNVST